MHQRLIFGSIFIALSLPCFLQGAEGESAGIVVSGTGEVKSKPNVAEILLANSGTAELTGDAVIKYTDSVRRTLEAFEALGMKNLQMTPQGLTFNSTSMGNVRNAFAGNQAQSPKAEMTISRGVRLVLRDIGNTSEADLLQAVGKIVDTARDSGATVVSPPKVINIYGGTQQGAAVTFVLENADQLREQAYQKAFAHAETRAQRLASLASADLGPVLSVEEVSASPASSNNPQTQLMLEMYGIYSASEKEDVRVTSDKFEEIPIRVTVKVRFGLIGKK